MKIESNLIMPCIEKIKEPPTTFIWSVGSKATIWLRTLDMNGKECDVLLHHPTNSYVIGTIFPLQNARSFAWANKVPAGSVLQFKITD